MTKPIGVFFGKNHDHAKNTAPFAPVFREIDRAGLEVLIVTSPELQMEQHGEYREVHKLRVIDGKTAAVAIEGAFSSDDFSMILDRTGTLKLPYEQIVVNDQLVRQIGQGKAGDRSEVADMAGVAHAFDAESGSLGDAFDSAVSGLASIEGLRIYHHISPGLAELWAPVIVGSSADSEKPVYIPVPKEIVPDELVAGSFALTRSILAAAGKQHAFAAPAWSIHDGAWTVTKPNTGNVQFGALKKEKNPDAFVTRQNLGKQVAHIALNQ